jgi:hypothetical protein
MNAFIEVTVLTCLSFLAHGASSWGTVRAPHREGTKMHSNFVTCAAAVFAASVLGATSIQAQTVECDAQYTGNKILATIINNRNHPIRVRQTFFKWVCQAADGSAVQRAYTLTCTGDCDVEANDSRDDIATLVRTTDCNVVNQGCGLRIDNLPPR